MTHLENFLSERLLAYPDNIRIAVVLIFASAFTLFHAGLFIFLRRVKQSIDVRRDARYREIITNMLAHIILYDEPVTVEKAVQHFVPRFEKLPLKSSPVRQLLVKELLVYHSNFTGRTAEILKGIYLGLKLDHFARKKVRSCHWERQVEGIRELTQLWIRQDAEMILRLGISKNPTLRMEAQTSFIKLSTDDSFRFLDQAREPILEWHQVVLFEVITKTRNVRIPSFGRWLASENDSVVVLCLKLIDHYQQLETIPDLISLLQHPQEKIREKVIRVLGKLEAEAAEPYLYAIYPDQSMALRAAILKAMGRIASGNYLDFLTTQTGAEDFQIRMGAMQSLREHGRQGAELLKSLFEQSSLQNREIMNHVFDTRIKV